MITQIGVSATADFEQKTWTFEMGNDFLVRAGEYAIVDKEKYDKMVATLEKLACLNKNANSLIQEIIQESSDILEKLA